MSFEYEYEAGRWRTLPKLVVSSPVLPLPVEFVAGGDGKPEPLPESLDSAPGLGGGSGNDGRLFGEEIEPKKIADKGRD